MTISQSPSNDDGKMPITHEGTESVNTERAPIMLVSHYAKMQRGAAIRKFWRRFTIGLSVSVAAM